MSNDQENANAIRNHGQPVPVVAFYSIQGGVGKSTLAQKFAELVTLAPGNSGRKPNVLAIDLDVDSKGLTYRWTQQLRHPVRTVHEIIAERNIASAHALRVTPTVVPGVAPVQSRGQIYLVPAASPEARHVYDTGAQIERGELLDLLRDLIRNLVTQYDISCVVIDCKPGPNPYAAAAATLADAPLLIGRNEPTTYSQIHWLPEQFREMYPSMQSARQRVVINAVAAQHLYDSRAQEYTIFDWIPLISDVIHMTEGHMSVDTFRIMMFDQYMVEIIKRVLVGRTDLIPSLPEVVGKEWIDTLKLLERCAEAPRMRRYGLLRHLRWVGGAVVLAAIGLAVWHQLADVPPSWLKPAAIATVIGGLLIGIAGWWAQSEHHRILGLASELVFNGPGYVLQKIQSGSSHRKDLDEMRKLAGTIPKRTGVPLGSLATAAGGE
jgi:MinD-like ATPase involved in chromosome partitioning or flagellar assembly